jgi:hypothetical protein
MGGIGTSIKQIMDEQTLQATETGLLGAGQDIFHGMESFAKELPGVGDLLGGSAAAPKHAGARHGKAPAHQAAAEHHAATHGAKGAAHAPAGQQHASKGHAQHGPGTHTRVARRVQQRSRAGRECSSRCTRRPS